MGPNSKIRIVFLPASVLFEGPLTNVPNNRDKLQEELNAINESLREAEKDTERHLIQYLDLELGNPVSIWKMSRLLSKKPRIVHFSDFAIGNRNPELTETKKLRDEIPSIFKLFGEQILIVCLNGCYSENHAEAIVDHVGCVIGSKPGLPYKAAMDFVSGLYENLFLLEKNVKEAFEGACLNLRDLPDSIPPEIAPRLKPGEEDPMRLVLWGELTVSRTEQSAEDIATEGFRTTSLNKSSPSVREPNGEEEV
jgi:hypothetical protein